VDAGRAPEHEQSAADRSHLAFVPTGDGYRLAALDGPAPEVGVELEVPGLEGRLRVTRVSRSPLPLDARACVFLERLPA
jgi:hypothetical protein